MPDIQAVLKELRIEFGAISSAVISRDGTMIASDLPSNMTSDTITIMSAAIMGAAVTAHSELKIGQPRQIRIISEKHEMVLVGAGRKAMILTVVPRGARIGELELKFSKIIDLVCD